VVRKWDGGVRGVGAGGTYCIRLFSVWRLHLGYVVYRREPKKAKAQIADLQRLVVPSARYKLRTRRKTARCPRIPNYLEQMMREAKTSWEERKKENSYKPHATWGS